MPYTISISDYPAQLRIHSKNLFSIEIPDGRTHPDSGAILPLPETEGDFSEIGKLISEMFEYSKLDSGFELKHRLSDGEHIHGLGEDNDKEFGSLDRRGTIRDMVTGQRISNNSVTADYPIPFIVSSRGYGIYLDNTSNLTVDIGCTVPDKLIITAPDGACRIYLILGENIPEIVCKFSEITGRAKLPPLWVLGYMQSKCSFWDWEEVDDVIATYKRLGIPLDSIVFDFDWAQYFNNYKWADRWEDKSPEKIKGYLENDGIHFMASNSGPMLKSDSDTFESAKEAGILAYDTDGKPVICGHYSGQLMDFTNPDIEEWLSPQIKRIMDDGVEGWWLDLTEPEGDAESTAYHAGSRSEIHNIFSNSVTKTYHNIAKSHSPNKRSFVLTRTGTAGIQREPTALWTGDIYSEYGTLRAHIPEALNTQMSGISMWTCDTGGFISPTNNDDCPYNLYHNDKTEHAELYERWMQFGCFTPIFRSHHAGGEAVPFRYNKLTFDDMSHYIKLRYRLISYIYSLYYENYLTGTPIMRPLFWHYPGDEKAHTITDEYLFGENMLIAPVIEPQKNTRTVYLPEGKWYDFDYDYVYEGGREYEVYAPQNRIPVFVKAGGIIPMTDDIMNTRELDFGRLEAEVYPSGRSTAKIYADDGTTDNYLSGEYTVTEITCEEAVDSLRISLSPDNDKFPLREFIAHIHMSKAPTDIRLNGEGVNWVNRYTSVTLSKNSTAYFDEFNRILHVKMYLETGDNTLEISLDASKSYPDFKPFSEDNLSDKLPHSYGSYVFEI
ncbi:MAG: DUF5110 domain-containing protein [Oscillospiraceae bacterium]|nr:DUF5110 domain-containing protein [Oscillospiraceae bacterium]